MENLKSQIRGALFGALVPLMYFAIVAFLFFPGDAIFKNDEALFQLLVDRHFDEKTFPLVSFLGSSIPLPYGPVALWFHFLIRLFTNNIVVVAFVHSVVVFFGLLSFAFYFSRRLSPFSALVSICLVFSSPLLFLASRQPWDNTLLIPLTSMLLILVDQADRSAFSSLRFFLIGVFAGAMAGIHLMAGPFLVCLALALIPVIKKMKRRSGIQCLFLMALGFLIVVLPYAYGALEAYQKAALTEKTTVKHFWGDGRNLWWLFQRCFFFLSTWGARLRFSEAYLDFLDFVGQPWIYLLKVDVLGWPLKLVGIFVTLQIFFTKSIRAQGLAVERILGLALPATLLIYNFLNMPTEPHYFHPIWWMPFLAIIIILRKEIFWLQCLVALVAIVNFIFLLESHQFIHQNQGMQSMAYSTTIREQVRAWSEVCEKARENQKTEVKVFWNEIHMISHPLAYFNRHLPSCAGIHVSQGFTQEEADGVFSYGTKTKSDSSLVLSWKNRSP